MKEEAKRQSANQRRLVLMRRAERWLERHYGVYAADSDYSYNDMVRAISKFADAEVQKSKRAR